MIDMLVHDRRLKGTPPAIAENQWTVGAAEPIDHIVEWVKAVAKGNGGIKRLTIMAHGYENAQGQGGYGIQLGAQGLSEKTVGKFATLKGNIRSIILYSCGAANTAKGTKMRRGDGNFWISRLAAWTGAYVVASSATQYYSVGSSTKPLDFGTWEGDVYLYGPNGQRRLIDWGWEP